MKIRTAILRPHLTVHSRSFLACFLRLMLGFSSPEPPALHLKATQPLGGRIRKGHPHARYYRLPRTAPAVAGRNSFSPC